MTATLRQQHDAESNSPGGGKEPPHLAARGLGRKVDDRILVDQVSLWVERGDVLAVLGPSGSGKTSLLRLLNRLDEPTAGTVLIEGQDYRQIPPKVLRRRVGFVAQQPFLLPGTVGDNVRFGPAQEGRNLETDRVDELLRAVGLEIRRDRDAATLSGGEAQRVALARALANEPEALLLDEPTSSLDESSRQGIERLVQEIIRSRGLTCIVVTHDERQAQRMADYVALFEMGRVRKLGPVAEVLGA